MKRCAITFVLCSQLFLSVIAITIRYGDVTLLNEKQEDALKCEKIEKQKNQNKGILRSKRNGIDENRYLSETHCQYVIEAIGNSIIEISFIRFELEDSTDCEYDNLIISDGMFGYSPLIGKYCGTKAPKTLRTSGKYAYIEFRTDKEINKNGFEIQIQFVATVPSEIQPACIIQVTDQENTITSNSLAKNSSSYDCTWIIRKPPENRASDIKVVFDFHIVKLKKPYRCSSNRFELYEKTSNKGNLIRSFCGGTWRKQIETEEDYLFVRFAADKNGLGTKFIFWYSFVRIGSACLPGEFSCDKGICLNRTKDCRSRFEKKQQCNMAFNKLKCAMKLTMPEPPNTTLFIFGTASLIFLILLLITVIFRVRLSQKILASERAQNLTQDEQTTPVVVDEIPFKATPPLRNNNHVQIVLSKAASTSSDSETTDSPRQTTTFTYSPTTKLPKSALKKHKKESFDETYLNIPVYDHNQRRSSAEYKVTSTPWVERFHISDIIGTTPHYRHDMAPSSVRTLTTPRVHGAERRPSIY